MNIQKIMPNINKYIDETRPFVKPSETAHEGLIVPEIIMKFGSLKSKAKSLPNLSKYMIGCIKEMKKSYRELYQQPSQASQRISSYHLEELYELADDLGLDVIGFTPVKREYIFKEKRILYPNAIVLVMKMEHEIIATVPSKDAEKEIFRTYYQLAYAANIIKNFLNDKGYNAEAGPSLGGEVNYPMLAESASLGVVGKHGLLITENLGPSLRLGAVYTDIENLPIKENIEHLWIKEFCNNCGKCVRNCPAKAIYMEPVKFDDGSLQNVDYKKCAVPFSTQNGCTLCIKECVFFGGNYDKIKEAFK